MFIELFFENIFFILLIILLLMVYFSFSIEKIVEKLDINEEKKPKDKNP